MRLKWCLGVLPALAVLTAAAQPSIAPCPPEHYRAPAGAADAASLRRQIEVDARLAWQLGDTELTLIVLCSGAAAGVPFAETMIAAALAGGLLGVKQDPARARTWLERAAGRGDPGAQLALSNMYFEAEGGPARIGDAMDLLRQAAASGLPKAQLLLGLELSLGRYVPRNLDAAAVWLERAERGGEASAGKLLQELRAYRGQR